MATIVRMLSVQLYDSGKHETIHVFYVVCDAGTKLLLLCGPHQITTSLRLLQILHYPHS